MEWSNSEKEPTKNWINHGRLGEGASHNQLLQMFSLPTGFLSPNSNMHSFE